MVACAILLARIEKVLNKYTVVIEHPDERTLEYVHIHTVNTHYVHLMFFGLLANEWGYGWDDLRFTGDADLSVASGTIMIIDQALPYEILPGHQKPGD